MSALLVGCGDGGATGSGSGGSTSSSSGNGGSGGMPIASSSSSSSPSSGEGGGGGSAVSGTGGADPCAGAGVHLEGALDGTSVVGDYSKGQTGGSLMLSVNFGSGGMLRVKGSQGTLRMPDDGPEPGVWFVTGTGSKATKINGHSGFTLKSLKRLGTCATAMGTGDLAFCLDDDGGCPGGVTHTATGTVNGTPFDWGGYLKFDSVGFSDEGLYVRWKSGAAFYGLVGGPSKINTGILWMPSGAPDSNAFWCSGSGSYSESFGGSKHINVKDLKRLGTTAEATAVVGQIDGCY